MNLILLRPEDFVDPHTAEISGRRAIHVNSIINARPGDTVRAGIIDGLSGTGIITCAEPERLRLEVKCEQPPPEPLPLTLVCAMQRPKTMRKVMQCATSMGVKKIIIIETWKVEKSYWNSPLLEESALREELLLGLEQGMDTVMPAVELRRRFRPFAEDELPLLTSGAAALIAHPGAERPCPAGVRGKTVLALGPEGGFTGYEVGKFVEAGFTPVNLGARIIRTEFAVAAILGRITAE